MSAYDLKSFLSGGMYALLLHILIILMCVLYVELGVIDNEEEFLLFWCSLVIIGGVYYVGRIGYSMFNLEEGN